jgi:predicted MFS family arabinose efflux permease
MSMLLAVRVFLPFALGYLLASIFRSVSALIATDLAVDLGLSPSELGFAVSAFFLSAVVAQVPYGILLDRFDPRRVYAAALIICAAGAVMVALTPNMIFLALGRALIALGSSASVVTSFTIHAIWFPPDRVPLANGLGLAAGFTGLIIGTAPADAVLQVFDWRDLHLMIASLLVISAFIVVAVAPAKDTPSRGLTLKQQLKGLWTVIKSGAFWRVAPLIAVMVGILNAFPALWTGPWARDVAAFADPGVANLMLTLTSALAISGLMTGLFVALARRIGIAPLGLSALSGWLLVPVLLLLYFQWIPDTPTVFVIWFLFGFITPFGLIIHAALTAEFPPEFAGRVNACLTLSWFLGSFLVQNIYGFALEQFPIADGGYALPGHASGMGAMIILMVISLLWFHARGFFRVTPRRAF